jgi:hypothetical protein
MSEQPMYILDPTAHTLDWYLSMERRSWRSDSLASSELPVTVSSEKPIKLLRSRHSTKSGNVCSVTGVVVSSSVPRTKDLVCVIVSCEDSVEFLP